ncbi:MAG: hypothetical protein DHS20C18_38920 [Saprospiraceae bacterium]|nr:MAG: hypothetical protein DHS20C18_38920 [Saprospiraceae bacterium]
MLHIQISPFHWYRLTALPLLALVLLHFVVYRKLPFEAGYQFPWVSFFLLLGIGLVVCQCNYEVHRRLGQPPKKRNSVKQLLSQFALGWLVTALVFTVLYAMQLWVFNASFNLVKFLGYLWLMLGISSLESAVLTLRDWYGFLQQKKPSIIKPPIVEHNGAQSQLLNISSRHKIIRLPIHEIAYIYSSGGIVSFHPFDGPKITSDFNALEEVEALISSSPFFRLNRQYLVNRKAIRKIENAENRKLKVTLNLSKKLDLTVSRYKARAFKEWFSISAY